MAGADEIRTCHLLLLAGPLRNCNKLEMVNMY